MAKRIDLVRYLLTDSTADFPQLHMDPVELNDLVEQMGVGCELRRSVICPCVRRETGVPRSDCEGCHGTGRLYPANRREDVVAMVSGRNPARSDYPAGVGVQGDVQITFPAGIIPGRGDMLLPCREAHVVDQVLHFGAQDARSHASEYAAAQGLEDIEVAPPEVLDRFLLYPAEPPAGADPLCIETAYKWVEGSLTPLEALEGVDFQLVGNKVVPLGSAPLALSVRYRAPAAYLIEFNPSVHRQEAGVVYPYKVVGHRIDKWSKRDLR